MRNIVIVAIIAAGAALASPAMAKGRSGATVHVKAHTTNTGTYVPAHTRTAPDRSKYNNWSTKGNVNPYTGEAGTKDPNKR